MGQISPDREPLIGIGFAYAGLGEIELAMKAFEKAIKSGNRKFEIIESSPHIENIKNDKRFKEFISKYETQKNE